MARFLKYDEFCDAHPYCSGPELEAMYDSYCESYEDAPNRDLLGRVLVELPLECGHTATLPSNYPVTRLFVKCEVCGKTSDPAVRLAQAAARYADAVAVEIGDDLPF